MAQLWHTHNEKMQNQTKEKSILQNAAYYLTLPAQWD